MSRARIENLLSSKLLIVTGKGGVGKTTTSLALGLLAAASGRRTLITEIHSEESVANLLHRPPIGYRETEILPRLWAMNIQPRDAFREYVLTQIRLKQLYNLVFENRLVRHFIDAAPGLSELMCIGKVYDLTKGYDLVIMDAPATGHSMALLEIPFIVSRAIRVGPLRSESAKIISLLSDPRQTAVALVTLPEEMPVTEALEMDEQLEERIGIRPRALFLNQVHRFPFSETERSEVVSFQKKQGVTDPVALSLDLLQHQCAASEEYAARLKQSRFKEYFEIPFIYSKTFGLAEVERIADGLENAEGDS